MEKKFNCWKCKYKGELSGDAHICCRHPENAKILNQPLAQMFGILASVGRTAPFTVTSPKLNIQLHPFGVKRGWANYPINFDPTWIMNCDGYEVEEGGEK